LFLSEILELGLDEIDAERLKRGSLGELLGESDGVRRPLFEKDIGFRLGAPSMSLEFVPAVIIPQGFEIGRKTPMQPKNSFVQSPD